MFIVIKFLLLLCMSKFKNVPKFCFAFGDRSSYFNFRGEKCWYTVSLISIKTNAHFRMYFVFPVVLGGFVLFAKKEELMKCYV